MDEEGESGGGDLHADVAMVELGGGVPNPLKKGSELAVDDIGADVEVVKMVIDVAV